MEVIDLSSGNYAVIDEDGDFIVFHKIEDYCVKNDHMIGYRVDPKGDNDDGSDYFRKNLGYFDLDLKGRKIVYQPRLTRDDFDEACSWF